MDSRVWLVTGVSSGIGNVTVQEVLAAGERVAAVTRKASSVSSLRAQYPEDVLLILEYDVGDPTSSPSDLIKNVVAHFSRLDVVVNNAAYGLHGVVESLRDEDAKKVFDVNFWGPVGISREAVRYFRENNAPSQGGRILNISTMGGFCPFPTVAFYASSKAALDAFSEAFQKELDPSWNIKVVIIQPGFTSGTQWFTGNLVNVSLPPSYADPEKVPAQVHSAVKSPPFVNDPKKVAHALITISKEENPPMRLPLGPDARDGIRDKLEELTREFGEWEKLGLSTGVKVEDDD